MYFLYVGTKKLLGDYKFQCFFLFLKLENYVGRYTSAVTVLVTFGSKFCFKITYKNKNYFSMNFFVVLYGSFRSHSVKKKRTRKKSLIFGHFQSRYVFAKSKTHKKSRYYIILLFLLNLFYF